MKSGDLVWWTHEYTKERHILYVLEVLDDGKVKCLFPYGAYYYAEPKRLEIFERTEDRKGESWNHS
tara:strand:+ start:403 stop:600 length:198 start_codon:yes stop_codon:yes gene_type:complete